MDSIQARTLLESGLLSQYAIDVHERDGRLAVNNRVALRVKCDVSTPRKTDLEVISDDQSLLGVLCFTSVERGGYWDKTEYAIAAYLTELQPDDFTLARPLQHDYFVIERDLVFDYFSQYAMSSAIWGGFVHVDDDGEQRVERNVPRIKALRGVRPPLDASTALCQRAIYSSHPFERFLRHYHQLELLVDWYVAKRISKLPDDLNGFDKIMSSYNAGDLVRIKDLISTFCTNKAAVREKMNGATNFMATAESMFQEFGKAGNPLNAESWLQWKSGTIAEKDVLGVAAYWIFRVRCSIAHHRVGEYLIKDSDEEFVVSFAEPLLLEVVRQVLANEKLQKLA